MVVAWVRNAKLSSFDKKLDTSFLAVLEASLTLIRFHSPSVAKSPAPEYEKHQPHMQGYNLVGKMPLELKSGAACELFFSLARIWKYGVYRNLSAVASF